MQTIIRTWCKRKHSGGAKDAFIIFLGILLRVKSEDYNYRTRTLEAFFSSKEKKKRNKIISHIIGVSPCAFVRKERARTQKEEKRENKIRKKKEKEKIKSEKNVLNKY